MEYWLISIPNSSTEGLQLYVQNQNAEIYYFKYLPIQRLRVGTIDKLILLSDELVKIDRLGQTLVQKLHKTYTDIEETSNQQLDVLNKPIPAYIQNFEWDEGHFNLNSPLKDLVSNLQSNMNKTSEHLRKWQQALTSIQGQLQIIVKKKNRFINDKIFTRICYT